MNAGNTYSSMTSMPVITYKELSLGERNGGKEKGERGQEVMLNFFLEYDFEAQLGVFFFS